MTCIATFYTYFGAMSFKKLCDSRKVPARLMPVPRALSSSCGTCVRFEAEEDGRESFLRTAVRAEELEQIVECTDDGYRWLHRSEE